LCSTWPRFLQNPRRPRQVLDPLPSILNTAGMNDANDLESSGVPLSDMIETLRTELQQSMQRGAGQKVAFAIDKADLELKVAVSQKGKAGAGIAFWVVKAEAGVEGQRDFAHTFRLTLKPVSGTTGAPINIAALTSRGEAPDNN